jgi:predicted phosphodiesterase
MRLGLIADVHGNLPALETALAALERERVDGYICAGDLVGYGPHPNEVVARVRALGAPCVAGNHDLMALGRLSTDRADELARQTLAWTRDQLTDESRGYLDALPATVDVVGGGIVLAHGTLSDPTRYVRTPDDARAALAEFERERPGADLLVIGHTHVPMAFGAQSGRRKPRQSVELGTEDRWIVNPGSVGQPREWRRVVRFAVIDTDRRNVVFHALGYDHRQTARDLDAAGLPARAIHRRPRLGYRLKRAAINLARGEVNRS